MEAVLLHGELADGGHVIFFKNTNDTLDSGNAEPVPLNIFVELKLITMSSIRNIAALIMVSFMEA